MKIAVYGAGGIGCYVGGRLAATGSEVTLVGRQWAADEIARNGLRLTDWQGADLRVPAADVRFETQPSGATEADLVLVTVKCAATAAAAEELAAVLKPTAVVLSLQNGLHNADVLRERLPNQVVLAGMVPFNVLKRGNGTFHQGTEGGLEVEQHPALSAYADAFERAGLPLTQHAEILPAQWAKMLLNLNNAVNALSNLPLRDELAQHSYRRCFAAAQAEALSLLHAVGIVPARLVALPIDRMPGLLRLPDFAFRRLARRMLAIDPVARSSMWEDLQAGRRTEVDQLNGEVVRLAASIGRKAPVNQRLVELVHEAESGGRRSWSGPDLLAALTANLAS
ncbi:MAG TPA: 2-dehydropantoate 2-reductase [Kribbella sp.]|nr:2-dehydropantoate 2-reductase [Kribbella sp.]